MMNENTNYTNPTEKKQTMETGPAKEFKTKHNFKEPEFTRNQTNFSVCLVNMRTRNKNT